MVNVFFGFRFLFRAGQGRVQAHSNATRNAANPIGVGADDELSLHGGRRIYNDMNIKLTGLCRLIKSSLMMSDFPSLSPLSLSLAVNHGTVRTVVDMLRVPGQVSHTEAIAMPALLLHGALHGGSG